MSYTALALKYRPRVLEDLIGQDVVRNNIKGMLQEDRINRTIFISGPYGSGKTTVARLIARYVNCEGERNLSDDPCGSCEPCRRMEHAAHSDYREINAADTRGIDSIRALRDRSTFMPSTRYRIYVLDEAQGLTRDAFQALLKILEEPPPSTIFILCTSEPQKIPSATISRCFRLSIEPVASQDTVKILQRVVEGEKLDQKVFGDDLLFKVANAVQGHPRDAIATLESMVHNISGRGGLGEVSDLESLVQTLAEEIIGESPINLAGRFLTGVYQGKYTKALLALRDVKDRGAFIDTLLQFHTETMNYRFSEKLRDKMMFAWYAKLDEDLGNKESLDPGMLIRVMEILLDASSYLRGYDVDVTIAHYALINMAVRAVHASSGFMTKAVG